jgi:predicted aldo/keto reductase-like oxidoreductase
MPPVDRRTFLQAGATAGLAAGLLPLLPAAARAETPRIRRQVRLGRTDLKVSDIGFGSSRLKIEGDLVRHALDRGITYFDTAESYTGGHSEETLGQALQGVRDQVVLVSKIKAGARDDRATMMRRLEGSLRRLRTEWIDVCFNHAVNDVDRMKNPQWGEFLLRATEEGKIRWRGMSGHGGRLVECLDYAIDHELVDVVLVGFNFGQDPAFHQRFTSRLDFVAIQPDLPRVLRKARKKDVAIVAMKTLRGAKLNDMRAYEKGGATFAQAAFRWVFSTGLVDSLIVSMRATSEIDEYLGASGWTRQALSDGSLLTAYERDHGASQCRYGCTECLDSCPANVPINDVLRTRMYDRDYGDTEQGHQEYARLGNPAEACLTCAEPTCACPFGLAVSELTRDAGRRLG